MVCISFFTHVFTTHYIFKKPVKNNGANTQKKCAKENILFRFVDTTLLVTNRFAQLAQRMQ